MAGWLAKLIARPQDVSQLVSQGRAKAGLQAIGEFGGARRDRTADLVNAIHALSQLSYGPYQREFGNRATGFQDLT